MSSLAQNWDHYGGVLQSPQSGFLLTLLLFCCGCVCSHKLPRSKIHHLFLSVRIRDEALRHARLTPYSDLIKRITMWQIHIKYSFIMSGRGFFCLGCCHSVTEECYTSFSGTAISRLILLFPKNESSEYNSGIQILSLGEKEFGYWCSFLIMLNSVGCR